MTTIAEFLNQTSGNSINLGAYSSITKVAADDASANPLITDVAPAAVGAAGSIVLDGAKNVGSYLWKNYGQPTYTRFNPTPKNVGTMLDEQVNWDRVNSGIQKNLKGQKPIINTFQAITQNNTNLQNKFVTTNKQLIYDYYSPKDKDGNPLNWNSDSVSRFQNDFSRGAIPDDLQKNLLNANTRAFVDAINSNDDYFYTTMYNMAPEDKQKQLDSIIGTDPRLRSQLIQPAKEHFKGYYDTWGTDLITDPNLSQKAMYALTPLIEGRAKDILIDSGDALPDEEVGEGELESDKWNTDVYGNNSAYKGLMNRYYTKENPNKTHRAVFGALRQYKIPKLGVPMLNNYASLPMEDRENSALNRSISYLIQLGEKAGFGDTAEIANAKAFQEKLPQMVGTSGENAMPIQDIYEAGQEAITPLYDMLEKQLGGSPVYDEIMGSNPLEGLSEEQLAQIDDAYNYLRDNPWETGYFGLLKDPNVRRAVQYAAPWLSYGVPAAALASMLGNNSLWPLVLLGGLGSGVFGYGAEPWFKTNPDTLSNIDSWVGKINGPISALGSYLLPEGTSQTLSNLLSGDYNTKETQEDYMNRKQRFRQWLNEAGEDFFDEEENTALPQGNQTTYYQGGVSYPGSSYNGYGGVAPSYYVNQGYNPMHVGSQFLGYA